MNLQSKSELYGAFWPANYGLLNYNVERQHIRLGFLRFVWLALVLAVVAIVEPSPGDIGIAVLLFLGFIFDKLSWSAIPVLPIMLLSLFVVANLVSLCYASDLFYAANHGLITLFMLTFWIFTLGVVTKFEERGLRMVMSGYTVGGLLSAALALLAYLGVLSKITSDLPFLHTIPLDESLLFYGERLRGFFKDPNVFGPYMVVIAAYALCLLQSRRGSPIKKIFWIGACLLASVSVLLSFSRAAWGNYVVTLAVAALLNTLGNRERHSSRRGIITFLIVGTVVVATVGYTLSKQRVNEVAVDRSVVQTYDEDRFIKQSEALELGLKNPLGIGPGQSHLVLGYNPHSLPLALFAENGIIGLLSLMVFVLATLIRSLVLSQKATNTFQRSIFIVVSATIAGILVNSLVIDPIHWRHFWFLLALGWMPLWASGTARRVAATSTLMPTARTPAAASRDRNSLGISVHSRVEQP